MTRRLTTLTVTLLVLWVVSVFPAKWLWGEAMMLQSLVALGLCLVPAAALLALAEGMRRLPLEWRMGVRLLGTMLRMGVVLGATAVLYYAVPALHAGSFVMWVMAYYLATVAVEVVFLAADQAALGKSPVSDVSGRQSPQLHSASSGNEQG